jgi:hypothetical protein
VGLSPLGTAATSGLLYKPHMIDEGDCGAIGGMKIVRGNWVTQRKPAPAPLCPPQIPHDHTRARNPDCHAGKPVTNRLSYGTALLVPCLDYSLAVKMEVICSSEMSGFLWTTLRYNQEDCTLHNYCHKNCKSTAFFVIPRSSHIFELGIITCRYVLLLKHIVTC